MAKIKKIMPDALVISGAALVSYGAWMLHPASGLIVSGVFCLFAGVKIALSGD